MNRKRRRSVFMDESMERSQTGPTMNLDVELQVLGIASDAWVAAWDFLVFERSVSSSFLSMPLLSTFSLFCLSLFHLYP
jgi:hypothetical protein